MRKKQHQKENTAAILRSIISANEVLHNKLNSLYPELTVTQINIILLAELDFSPHEVEMILGVTSESIHEVKVKTEKQ
jgi:hypothetical protein